MDKEYEDDYYPQGDEVDTMPDENYAPEPTQEDLEAQKELDSLSNEEVQAMWDATVGSKS